MQPLGFVQAGGSLPVVATVDWSAGEEGAAGGEGDGAVEATAGTLGGGKGEAACSNKENSVKSCDGSEEG